MRQLMGQVADGASGWLAALRGLPDNPLPGMWRLQEARSMARRSRWLSSPGLLTITLLLSGLASFVLVRQLLVLLAGRAAGGMNPLYSSSSFWIALVLPIKCLLLFTLCLLLARLYRTIRSSIGFLDRGGRPGSGQFDDMLLMTTMTTPQLLTAHLAYNMRCMLPPIWSLAFLLGIHRVLVWLAAPHLAPPEPGELLLQLLLLPLASAISASIAFASLSLLMLGAGDLRDGARTQVLGAGLMLPTQLGLSGMLLFTMQGQTGLILSNALPLQICMGLVPLVILAAALYVASFSEFYRRGLAGGFGVVLLFGFISMLGFAMIIEGRILQYEQGFEGFCAIWGSTFLQSLCVIPLQADILYANLSYGQIYAARWLGDADMPRWRQLFSIGLPLASVAVQLLVLRMAVFFASYMLEQRREGKGE